MSEMAAVAGAVARAAAESAFAAMEEVATVIPGSFHFFSAQPRSARRTGAEGDVLRYVQAAGPTLAWDDPVV
eukprot:scaffold129369_cov36-Phaeocystis_antarctica.AAC.2